MPCESLDVFCETETHSKARDGCHVSIFLGWDVTKIALNNQPFLKGHLGQNFKSYSLVHHHIYKTNKSLYLPS